MQLIGNKVNLRGSQLTHAKSSVQKTFSHKLYLYGVACTKRHTLPSTIFFVGNYQSQNEHLQDLHLKIVAPLKIGCCSCCGES